MTNDSDIFRTVHKGIRNALFDLCVRIGKTELTNHEKWLELQHRARAVLRFVERHGENEDLFLLPLIEVRAPEYYKRMRTAHRDLEEPTEALRHAIEADPQRLYEAACYFTARYLDHMHEEETDHLPVLQIHLSPAELGEFTRSAIARSAPTEQDLILGYMLGSMTDTEVAEYLARISATAPADTQARVRGVASVVRKGTP